ncbi:MAG: 2-C-methyl-D-erythritol 4-phosphate cytidylyltransferase [Gammaproteobacteria bacterium]
MQYWVIVPAAGTSQRMATSVPKQYLPLSGSTVIEASLRNFLKHPNVLGVVVALHKDDSNWENLAINSDSKIHTVLGGESRSASVLNAIRYLKNTPAEDQDFVIVHDAARPCLRYTDLELLMQQLENDDVGGILAAPVIDTLKVIEKQDKSLSTIVKTLDRESIWRALTPQMFRLDVLSRALEYCVKQNIDITDEASAIEQLGLRVKLVKGQSDNIKITHTEDIELAAGVLKKINHEN